MTKHGRIHITEEKKAYIEQYWGPIDTIGDKEAQEIAQEIIADEITDAYFEDDETIRYSYEDRDYRDEYYSAPRPAFTPEYLRYIGMSMSDFI